MRASFAVVVLSVAISACGAEKSVSEYHALCGGHDPDPVISSCTHLINSGHETTRHGLFLDFYYRGGAYALKGNNDRAIADYGEAIALEPNEAAAYVARGNAFEELIDRDQAIQDYTRAISLDPADPVAFHDRGNAYFLRGDMADAIKDLKEALRLDPKDQWAATTLENAQLRALSCPCQPNTALPKHQTSVDANR